MNPNFGKSKEKDDTLEQQGYVYRIFPNEEQIKIIEKTFGCARFIWNKLLNDKKEIWDNYKVDVDPLIKEYKKEFQWLKEVDSLALCNSLVHLKQALSNFFSRKAKYPKFKSKRKTRPSFARASDNKHG